MTQTFTIREGTETDRADMIRQRRQMFEDMGHTDAAGLDKMTAAFAIWLDERLANGRYRAWFTVTDDGQIAAGAALWLLDWPPHVIGQAQYRGYILNVYTEHAFRRNGLARRLTEHLVAWCWENKIEVVILHASPQGKPIYEAIGFTPTNEMRLMKPKEQD